MFRTLNRFLVVLALLFTGCTDTGKDKNTIVEAIELSPLSLSLDINETTELNATAHYNDNSSKNVSSSAKWIIGNSTIVSIDGNGVLKALKIGKTTIKAKIDDINSNETVIEVQDSSVIEYQLPHLKNDMVYLRVNPFGEGSYNSTQGKIDFDSDRNMSDNYIFDYFKKSDKNITIIATPKNNTRIRTWTGCDDISQDKTKCIVSLKSSHEVTPIFEYKEFITVDNLYDITNVKKVTYDWNATTQTYENDIIIVKVDDSNLILVKNLEKVSIGDYINYSNPKRSFLRKVEDIKKISEYKYKIVSTEVPLNEVIKQGTIYIKSDALKVGLQQNKKAFSFYKTGGEKMLSYSTSYSKSYSKSYSQSKTISGDGYSATGTASSAISIGLALNFRDNKLDSWSFDASGSLKIKASGEANKEGSESKELFSKPLFNKSVPYGIFLISLEGTISSQISIEANAKADHLGASSYISASAFFNTGYHYSSKIGGHNYSTYGGDFSKGGDIKSEGNLKVSIPLTLSVNLSGYLIQIPLKTNTLKEKSKTKGSTKTEQYVTNNNSNDVIGPKVSGDVSISISPYAEVKAKCNQCIGRAIGNIGIDSEVKVNVEAGIYTPVKNFTIGKDLFSAKLFDIYKQIMNKNLPYCNADPSSKTASAPHGLFTATMSWRNPAAELSMTNPLMSKQGNTCTSYSIGSGDLTLYGVNPGHYPINVSASDTKYLRDDELPDSVKINVSTPGEGKILNAVIASRDSYNLGHVADIYIWRPKPEEPPVVIPIPTSGGSYYAGGGMGGWYIGGYHNITTNVSNTQKVRHIEKKLCTPAKSCGCKPCRYNVISYLNQASLGPISGGDYRIYKATEFGKSDIEYLYEGKTSIGDDIDTAGIMELPIVVVGKTVENLEQAEFMQKIQGYDGDFILEVSGGLDIDVDDNWKVDDDYTPLNGTVHAIISKKELLKNEYKVNILTELAFQVSKDLLGETYDRYQLDSRLNDIAKKVLIEKLYPKSSNPLGRNDIVYWLPNANKNWLIKDYKNDLHPIVIKVHNGEYIRDDAYKYIYDKVKNNQNPILAATWFKIDENITGKNLLGDMKVISEGNTSITSYQFEGEGSNKFTIDNKNGQIYLNEGELLDYEEKNYYDLFVTAQNSEGNSRPVLLRILVNDIADSPTFIKLKDGTIAEDAQEGAYVGQVVFDDNRTSIDAYQLAGPDKDEFTIDNNGVISVSSNADLDYEKYYGKRVSVTAHNSLGNSIYQRISIHISDVIDVPSIQAIEVHISENAPEGTVVAELNISSNKPIDNITLLGDDNRTFTVSTDGKIRVASNADIDYENNRDYLLNVVATNEFGLSKPASIHIIVDDENDSPTLGISSFNASYNALADTILGKVTVDNIGTSPILSYLLKGEGSDNFKIDTAGNVIVNAGDNLLDYQFKTFHLIVTATNDAGESLAQRLSITINSDCPLLGSLKTYVDENSPKDKILGAIPIISSSTAITSMKIEGDGSKNFVINNDGTLKVAEGANIDFEQRSSFDLTAYATNSEGESAGGHIHIRIYDMPDTIKIKGFSSTIYEDISADSLVGIVHVVYLGGHTLDHFELTGDGSSKFVLENSGQLKIVSNANFDSKITPQYHLAVVAVSKNGDRSNRIYLDISVVETINIVPQVTDLSLEIPEDKAVGGVIGSVKIVSKTQVVEQVWLKGEGSAYFEVNRNGVVKIKRSLDYETKRAYTLSIFAKNVLGKSMPAQLKVSVLNVIDDEPVLEDTNLTLKEDANISTVVGHIAINSRGTSAIENIILSGVGADYFSINQLGDISVAKLLDYETKKVYSLEAKAINAKATSELVNVIIKLDNIAENVPVLYNFVGFVEDNAIANTKVADIKFATKGDSLITGYIIEGTGKENFEVDNNGIVRISASANLDESIQKVYELSLVAINEAGKSDLVDMRVTLTYDKTKADKPSNLKLIDIWHNSITLGWTDNADNERGFNLYVDGVKYAVLDKNSTSYRLSGLAEETSYIFALKSFNDRGESRGISIEGITDIDRSEYFKSVLTTKCGISENSFDSQFNIDTGYYNGSIYCSSKNLTNEDLLNFKALKEVRSYLYLNDNKIINLDGLSKLKRVGGNFQIYNNRLVNVDGLSSLESVGSEFYLYNNQLTNLNGLSSLTSVGSNFDINNNQLTNIDGLNKLTKLGGSISVYKNKSLTDISGISNIQGSNGKVIYIDSEQYITKASKESIFCNATWDLRNPNGNIADDMTQLCDSKEAYTPSQADKFRDVLGTKCHIASSTFYNLFNTDTGYYNGSIYCHYKSLTDEDLLNFKVLKGVRSYLYLYHNQLTNLDGLSNLEKVGSLYLYNNKLTNIDGLSSLEKVGHLGLSGNKLTNIDGLSSLEKVGNLHLSDNKLTNIDGLSKLKRVGGYFHVYNNRLVNVDGLSSLESVGSEFSLYNNQLTNLNGLSSLTSVGSNFSFYDNQLTNLDGLNKLTKLGGYLSVYNNKSLTDISGISNIQGSNGKLIYIDSEQYTTKVSEESKFCNATWDLRNPNGNIADDMTQLCDSKEAYTPSQADKFRDVLGTKCHIASSTFYSYFNTNTGYYNGSIYCHYKSLTDEDLFNFKALKGVRGYLYLNGNQLTNLDGLSNLESVESYLALSDNKLTNIDGLSSLEKVGNLGLYNNKLTNIDGLSKLKRVGGYFHIYNNRLVNVDGLSSLESVGSQFYLYNNQLTNLNGLSSLTSVGSNFSFYNNQLTNLNGLSSLTSVGSNFSFYDNQLTNLDGLNKLTKLGGYLSVYNNKSLTDISGISNIQGSNGKVIYIDSEQYTTKASKESIFCNATWDLRNQNGNIVDDMTQVCDITSTELTDEEKLRNVLETKCNITSSTFYAYFNTDTGYYNGSIDCRYQGLTDEDLLNFKVLKQVGSYLRLDNNKLTNLDGLTNLIRVGQHFNLDNNKLTNLDGLSSLQSVIYDFSVKNNQLTNLNGLNKLTKLGGSLFIYNNKSLTDISGISNIQGSNGKLIYIDSEQYTTKANKESKLCNATWDLRNPNGNIADDMTQLCDSKEAYTPSQVEKFRDILGAKCNIASSTFYTNFNPDTGYYNGSIGCSSNNLTDEDLLNFKVLKELKDSLYLYNYKLTNVDGLSNLIRVGGDLYFNNNQLVNIDGLSKLESVGQRFSIYNNKLKNLNGLSKLRNLGGELQLRKNSDLTDISGISNIEGKNGQLLYINPDQYNVKANKNLKFCSTKWDLRGPNGDIADEMAQVCGEGPELTDIQKLRAVMDEKCSVSYSQFEIYFDETTGIYNTSLDCAHNQMNDEDLALFTFINQIKGSFSINHNNLTNLKGLINLKYVGGYFYLNNNQIADLADLSNLAKVNGTLDISHNKMFNLDALSHLTTVGKTLKIYNNINLTNIMGLSNVAGIDGKKIYIDTKDYATKADLNGPLCLAKWDIYDRDANIDDDMSKICEGYNNEPTDADNLRDLLGKRCSIDSETFYSNYDEDTSIYTGNIKCNSLTDTEMQNFKALLEVHGNLIIENSEITNINGLIRLKKVTASLGIQNNENLTNIHGLSNIKGVENQRLTIDDTKQYENKADNTKEFCATNWNLYTETDNIANDMNKVCAE